MCFGRKVQLGKRTADLRCTDAQPPCMCLGGRTHSLWVPNTHDAVVTLHQTLKHIVCCRIGLCTGKDLANGIVAA